MLQIPLAEYDLSVCYKALGQESETNEHLFSALTMWKNPDPELKMSSGNSMYNSTSKTPKSRQR
jgi:hypothetical protein